MIIHHIKVDHVAPASNARFDSSPNCAALAAKMDAENS